MLLPRRTAAPAAPPYVHTAIDALHQYTLSEADRLAYANVAVPIVLGLTIAGVLIAGAVLGGIYLAAVR